MPRPPRPLHRGRRLAVATAVLLIAVSCSGGEDARPAATTATSATTATTATTDATATAGGSSRTTAPSPAATSALTPTTAATTTPPTVPATTATTAAPAAALPVWPRDPVELARLLVATEAALADPATPDGDVAVHARQQQVLYGILGRTPEWREAAYAQVPAADLPRVSTLVDAGSAAAGSVGSPRSTVPAWTIRAPLPSGPLVELYQQAERATGVPWTVLAAIHFVETRMGRIVATSTAGAQGPMQFMPSTWEHYGAGGDIGDDADAIAAAAALLADRGAPADLAAALHAYNPSDAYVRSVLAYHQAMQTVPWLYRALHGWQVYVSTTAGVVMVPEGYAAAEEVPVEAFLAAHPGSAQG